MAIFSPEIRLTPDSKRLLKLLAALLSEEHNVDTSGTNRSAEHLPLSDSQAQELTSLITALLKNKDFLDKIAFIEGISAVRDTTDGRSLRKSYIAGRRLAGRKSVLSTSQWSDYQRRLDIYTNDFEIRATSCDPMTDEHFLQMERKLLLQAGILPPELDTLMHLIAQQLGFMEKIRSRERELQLGTIERLFNQILGPIERNAIRIHESHAETKHVAAAITIVANTSVLFTTRDWSVAGTISAISGSAIHLVGD